MHLGYTSTRKELVVYLKFEFIWVSYTLSDKPIAEAHGAHHPEANMKGVLSSWESVREGPEGARGLSSLRAAGSGQPGAFLSRLVLTCCLLSLCPSLE